MYNLTQWFSFFYDKHAIDETNSHEKINDAVGAIKKRNVQCLGHLLSRGLDPNSRDERGFSLIHVAILHARRAEEDQVLELVSLLINYGGDVNLYYQKHRYGPLTTAVRRKLPTIVNFLLSQGADTELQMVDPHKSALDYAKEFTDSNDIRGNQVLKSFEKCNIKIYS
jgi:ankyrin repeat protein